MIIADLESYIGTIHIHTKFANKIETNIAGLPKDWSTWAWAGAAVRSIRYASGKSTALQAQIHPRELYIYWRHVGRRKYPVSRLEILGGLSVRPSVHFLPGVYCVLCQLCLFSFRFAWQVGVSIALKWFMFWNLERVLNFSFLIFFRWNEIATQLGAGSVTN